MKRILRLFVVTSLVVFLGACSDGSGGGGNEDDHIPDPGAVYKTMGDFLTVGWMTGPGAQAWQTRPVTDFIDTNTALPPVFNASGGSATWGWIANKDTYGNVGVAFKQTNRSGRWNGLVISAAALGGFELGDRIIVTGRVTAEGTITAENGNRSIYINGDLDGHRPMGDGQGFIGRNPGENIAFRIETTISDPGNIGTEASANIRIQSNHWNAGADFPDNSGITTLIIERIVIYRGDTPPPDPTSPPAGQNPPGGQTPPAAVAKVDSFLTVNWMTGGGRPAWKDIPIADLIGTAHTANQIAALFPQGGTSEWIVDPDDPNAMAWKQTGRTGNWNGLAVSGAAVGGFEAGDTIRVQGRAVTEGTVPEGGGRTVFVNGNFDGQSVIGGNNAQGFGLNGPSDAAGIAFEFTVTVGEGGADHQLSTTGENAGNVRIQTQAWSTGEFQQGNNGITTIIIRRITITRHS